MGRLCTLMSVIVFSLVLFSSKIARSQTSLMPSARSSAQGQLTVTATVVCSASVVWDEKGTPHIVLANCPDPADNVSQLKMVVLANPQNRQPRRKAPHLRTGLYKSRLKRVRTGVLFPSHGSAEHSSQAHRSGPRRFSRRTQ